MSKALDVFSDTISTSSEEIAPAIQGVSDLSKTIATRDAQLRQLFSAAEKVTGTFRQRTDQIKSLIMQGNLLLAELQSRREALDRLFRSATQVADQVSGLVTDNQKQLKPALVELNQVLTTLQENKDHITVAIDRGANFIGGLGEGLAHGTYFNGHLGLNAGVIGIQQFLPGLAGGDGIIDPLLGAAK